MFFCNYLLTEIITASAITLSMTGCPSSTKKSAQDMRYGKVVSTELSVVPGPAIRMGML